MKQKSILLFAFLVLICGALLSQDNSPYFLNKTYDKYIDYLTNSRKIGINHPLNQPFTALQVRDFINKDKNDSNNYWNKLIIEDVNQYLPNERKNGNLLLGGKVKINLDFLESSYDYNYSGSAFSSYSYKNIIAFYGYGASTNYYKDTTYFGTTGKFENATFSRSNSAYLKYNLKHLNIFYGRLGRNYGQIGQHSLIRSDNPYSYDHFSFEFFNDIVKYTYSTTRLEDKYGYDYRDTSRTHDWYKRYYSFHRIEFSLSKRFKLGITESILYGGIKQAEIPAYINPMNIFFISKMNDRKGLEERNANAVMAVEFLAQPIKRVSIYSQFLIDDMDFTKNLRSQYPDRLGLYSKLVVTDIFPKSQLYFSYRIMSNWTYNSYYTYGNYTFFGKSLGFEKNGFENYTLGFDCFRLSKIFFSVDAWWQQERKQDLETSFIGIKTEFPIGIVQKTIGSSGELTYIPNIHFQSKIKIGVVNVNNYQNISKNNKSFVIAQLEVVLKGVFEFFNRKHMASY